jgi:tRNA G18 (ribose-2'-O)-methylase SpoU
MRKLRNEELNRLSKEQYHDSEKNPIIVVLDNVRSLNNIGSIFRTADGFRIEKIILCGISTPPPHRDIYKTALGAEESVCWEYFENTLDAVQMLRANGSFIAAVEQVEDSISLEKFSPPTNSSLALIFGHEIKGVQQEVINQCDTSIEIPQYGTKHSFNISVSTGIVLWEIFKKKHKETFQS